MKDIFRNYHKQKALSHLWILAISWVLALSINMFILGGPSWDTLKANIKELQIENQILEDISITQEENLVRIINSQEMENVDEMSISFAYNQDILDFWENMSSLPWVQVSSIETTPWFSTFILTFDDAVNLASNSEILEISYTRTWTDTIHLNPVNFNFSDSSGENYSLTAASIIF